MRQGQPALIVFPGADDLVIKPLDPAALERKLIAAERMTGLHRRMHADARQDPLTGVGNRLRLALSTLRVPPTGAPSRLPWRN